MNISETKIKNFPSISILVPTLNSARVLDWCLKSIRNQNYPQDKVEIIIGDGGSTDGTLEIARKYKAKIFENPLKTGEAGKAVALRYAQGELVALIDSDNILPEKNWFLRMVRPFSDPEIIGSEPWEFTYRKTDSLVNRYSALIGANDPYCYFIGNYDKKSILSGKWTGLNIKQDDQKTYLKIKLEGGMIPTIGANGTLWRRGELIKAVNKSQYLFDTQIPYLMLKRNPFYFAKVKVGIIHLFCHQTKDFYRKQKRRAKDFFYQEGTKQREETYQRKAAKQALFILATITVLPLVIQMVRGYRRKPDFAWFFHPIACGITLWLYASETLVAIFKKTEMDRKEWKQ